MYLYFYTCERCAYAMATSIHNDVAMAMEACDHCHAVGALQYSGKAALEQR